jgi:hypothetical protein
MSNRSPIDVYVPLLEEGSPTLQRTKAIPLEDNLYKLLPAENYNPEDVIWEYLPGSIVRIEKVKDYLGEEILRVCKHIITEETKVVEIYIQFLEDDEVTLGPVPATPINDYLFRILSTPDNDKRKPILRAGKVVVTVPYCTYQGKDVLLAVQEAI